MSSFDIVSKTDLSQVDNALQNMTREMTQRYDFKGSSSTIERAENILTINADDALKLKQMHALLQGHLTRRGLDAGCLDYKQPQAAAGQAMRQCVEVRQGIGAELAKKIVKTIKGSKLKIQAAIQGDELRITGKKRDDLQAVIERLKSLELVQPLQYVNFRD